MTLEVGGYKLDLYNSVDVSLRYDSVASTFGFMVYFNPYSAEHKNIFLPGKYSVCKITHMGQLLITGVLLNTTFNDSAIEQLTPISGYSKTGVLENCQYPTTLTKQPLQLSGLNLIDTCKQLIKPFNLNVIVSDNVKTAAENLYQITEIKENQSIKDYIAQLAIQRNIILSHTPGGDLLLTRGNGNKTPIYNFDGSNQIKNGSDGVWTDMGLTFNGDGMHHLINVIGQADAPGGSNNMPDSLVFNPYVQLGVTALLPFGPLQIPFVPTKYTTGFRPRVEVQTVGAETTAPLYARNLLGQEVKNVRINITIDRWDLNGKVPMPGDLITVTNPRLFLYQKTKLFIEQVNFKGDETKEIATLSCVPYEAYTNDTVINIFTGSNLTVPPPPGESGAKSTITPFL